MDLVPEIRDFEPPDATVDLTPSQELVVRPNLFGRENEIGRITEVLTAVEAEGHGRAIFLTGEAGAGKTAIATAAIAAAQDRGFVTVQTPCEPFHAGISLYPIKELIRKLTGGASVTTFVNSAFGPTSYEAGIALNLESEDADSSLGREYTMATFANAVIGRSKLAAQPVLLFLDDLERIDSASSDAILVLMSRIVDQPVVLLCASIRSQLSARTV